MLIIFTLISCFRKYFMAYSINKSNLNTIFVIGIVTGICEDHLLYDIGTRVGHLKIRLARNNITAISTHMKLEHIPSKNISSMRQLVRNLSHFGGQGYLHCSSVSPPRV